MNFIEMKKILLFSYKKNALDLLISLKYEIINNWFYFQLNYTFDQTNTSEKNISKLFNHEMNFILK